MNADIRTKFFYTGAAAGFIAKYIADSIFYFEGSKIKAVDLCLFAFNMNFEIFIYVKPFRPADFPGQLSR